MAKQTFEIRGIRELRRLLQVAGNRAPSALAGPLFQFANEQIANPSRLLLAPVVTGALRSSILTQPASINGTVVTVIVGAGGAAAPYALAVHENPRSGRTGGFSPSGRKYKRWSRVGQWKYLEQPAIQAAARGQVLAGLVRTEVERLFGAR